MDIKVFVMYLSIDDFKAIAGEISGKYYIQNRVGKDRMTINRVDEQSIKDKLEHFDKVKLVIRN